VFEWGGVPTRSVSNLLLSWNEAPLAVLSTMEVWFPTVLLLRVRVLEVVALPLGQALAQVVLAQISQLLFLVSTLEDESVGVAGQETDSSGGPPSAVDRTDTVDDGNGGS